MSLTIEACEEAVHWFKNEYLFRRHALGTYLGSVVGAVTGEGRHWHRDGVRDYQGFDAIEGDRTLFMIASVTKVFTSLLAAYAVDQKVVKLDDRVKDILEDVEGHSRTWAARRRDITLLDLLTHYAGLPQDPKTPASRGTKRPENKAELYETLASPDQLIFPPGQYLYSNMGFSVAGYLMAARCHKKLGTPLDWEDAVRQIVLRPLEMADTQTSDHFLDGDDHTTRVFNWRGRAAKGHAATSDSGDDPDPPASMQTLTYASTWPDGSFQRWSRLPMSNPGGGLWSTGEDMLRWVRFHLGLTSGVGALDRARDECLTIRRESQKSDGSKKGMIALGWEIDDEDPWHTLFWKGGDAPGYSSYVVVERNMHLGAFVLLNCEVGHDAKIALGKRILKNLRPPGGP